MEIADVVMKLVGNIEPIGETHVDEKRLENLKALTSLVDGLLHDICIVAQKKDCAEYSKSKAGKFADAFIKYIIEEHKQ